MSSQKGQKAQFKEKVGCRIRNLAAHLCSDFVWVSYFFECQTLLPLECSVSLVIVHIGNTWALKICEKICLYQHITNIHEYKGTSTILMKALLACFAGKGFLSAGQWEKSCCGFKPAGDLQASIKQVQNQSLPPAVFKTLLHLGQL